MSGPTEVGNTPSSYRHHIFSAMLVVGWALLGVAHVTDDWAFAVAAICAFVCGAFDYWVTR